MISRPESRTSCEWIGDIPRKKHSIEILWSPTIIDIVFPEENILHDLFAYSPQRVPASLSAIGVSQQKCPSYRRQPFAYTRRTEYPLDERDSARTLRLVWPISSPVQLLVLPPPQSPHLRHHDNNFTVQAIKMCFGGRGKGDDESGAARSRELDKIIRADEKRLSKEVKLLLLGMFCHFSTNPHLDISGNSIAEC